MIRSRPSKRFNPVQRQIGQQCWEISTRFSYEWDHNDVRYRIVIPEGFEYDGASVPRIIWPFISPFTLRAGAVVHDYLYRFSGDIPRWTNQKRVVEEGNTTWKDMDDIWSRWDADRLMCRVARDMDVSKWKRRTAFWGVCLFGRFSWGEPEPKLQVK